ncbi:beta-1,4-N-acetylglucosamine oligosaccharide N-methyltransferase NodS [Trinickia symbiotica]|uniref:Nodulation protein S n=1 Tax=Trinickia symbiotica TaxID=863227 RepID=A0A2N7WP93_9BURK|nr:nodulation methyltransferase NodS [Trinickia symbiotica]PMS31171.1 SAM-dependent methyltransferase [Trinickia symbiotica]PPK41326.1 beta-1,4-N-acetylglucosamine oligosaccharide N-methyltransferase NodS [Trinickia symbiotica]
MTLTHETNFQLLHRELEADDPWRLDSNPFEHERHRQMLHLSLSKGSIKSALEVGCARGAFTEKLAPHCERLTVIDIVPRAIARTRERMKDAPHINWIVSDVQHFRSKEQFDLIVVAEVLYYLDGIAEVRTAVRNLARMLAPAGQLVFGSARDANCQRWGHIAGAETVIAILTEELVEVDRLSCIGQSLNEDCLLACFRNPAPVSDETAFHH